MTSVRSLQPIILERVYTLIQRLQGFKDVKGDVGVIKANYAFAAFTNGKLDVEKDSELKIEAYLS